MNLWRYIGEGFTPSVNIWNVIEMNHTTSTVKFHILGDSTLVHKLNLDRFLRQFSKLSPVEHELWG